MVSLQWDRIFSTDLVRKRPWFCYNVYEWLYGIHWGWIFFVNWFSREAPMILLQCFLWLFDMHVTTNVLKSDLTSVICTSWSLHYVIFKCLLIIMNGNITIVPCLATHTVNKYSKGQFSYEKSNNFVQKEMWRILNHPIIVTEIQVTRLLLQKSFRKKFWGKFGRFCFLCLLKTFRLVQICELF